MAVKIIDIELSARVINGQLVAHLCLVNNSSNNMYLDEQTICYNNRVRGDFFKIKNEKCEDVDYTGIKVCRDIKPENFIPLAPAEKLETDINLSDVYELEKGRKYAIQYSTYHPSYLEEEELTKIKSNVIEIVYE